MRTGYGMKLLIMLAASAIALVAAVLPASAASCPQSKMNVLPSDAPIGLMCSSFGPNGANGDRFELRVYLTNHGKAKTTAVKLQANMFDAFGTLVRTWQFDEPMGIAPGSADYDNALYGQHMIPAIQTVDHVDLYVLGVAYADGTTWTTAIKPDVGPTPSPDDRFHRL